MKHCLLYCCTILFFSYPFVSQARDMVPAGQHKPLSFIENKGQVTGRANDVRTDIDVKLQVPGINIFIGAGAVHYQWNKIVAGALPPGKLPATKSTSDVTGIETYRMDLELVGANNNATLVKEMPQDYFENYYLPSNDNGITAHAFNKIIYKDIYPHIDWVLYISNNRLKYDFIVYPGGRVKDIRLKYNGATGVQVQDGAFTATTPLGNITEQKPYSYNAATKEKIASSFILKDGILGFAAAQINGTLVIDPLLEWASYFGGTGTEVPFDITTDAGGNVYMAGYTNSNNLATAGVYQQNIDGQTDGFIVKFSKTGQRLWSTYFGGNFDDDIYSIASTPDGIVYVTGITSSANGIVTPPLSSQQLYAGNSDAFIAKFDASGMRIWGRYYGGGGQDGANQIAIDQSENIYIAGYTQSNSGIATLGAYQSAIAGNSDAFLAKFSKTGQRIWGTYYGQFSDESGNGVACSPDGDVYLCGQTFSLNMFIKPGGHQLVFGGGANDAYLVKFDNDGLLLWNTYYGGNGNDEAYDIACDAGGDVYMAGNTSSPDAIASPGAYQQIKGSVSDGFLIKFNKSGVRQWGTFYGGNAFNVIYGIAVSPDGYVYTSGYTQSSTGIATPGSYQPAYGGGIFDGVLAQFSKTGARNWATYYGGLYREVLYKATCDFAGNVYICGYTDSTTTLFTPGAFQQAPAGNWDAFIAKFQDTTVFTRQPFTDTIFCIPSAMAIAYMVQKPFRSGNTFTVQLSDATGSFANPVNIGAVTADSDGTIPVTIPATTPPGDHYRIRIVASAPAFVSQDNGVDIHVMPTPPQPVIAGKTDLCSGDSIYLAIVNPATGVNYRWTGPNGYTGTNTTVNIQKAGEPASGIYTVAAGGGVCRVADSVTVTVKSKPYMVSEKTNSPICADSTLLLDVVSNDTNVIYSWYGPNGYVSHERRSYIPLVTESHSGRYSILLTGANGCVSDTNGVEVRVIKLKPQIASVGIKSPGDTLILNSSVNWDSVGYTWSGPNGFYSNDTNAVIEDITKAAYGYYTLTVNYRGCTGTTGTDVVVSENINLYLYPNPNDGNFTVKGNILDNNIINMEVVDEAGRSFYRDSVKPFRKHFEKQIHLGNNLANGVYILRTTIKDKDKDLKFEILR